MELLEYQAKELLQRFRIPCPPHFLIEERTVDRFRGGEGGVLRPQARGEILEGGERSASNGEEVVSLARQYLGKKIVTKESGREGFLVEKVLFLPNVHKEKELSLWVGISSPGDVKVQVRDGEKLFFEVVTERKKLFRYQCSRLVSPLPLSLVQKETLGRIIDDVVAALFFFDATFIEINPLVITEEKKLLAYKVRMSVDERAFFRQKELQAMSQARQATNREKLTQSPFPYVLGNGNIGCLANGRGIGMYTASQVHKSGGTVAGVIDVGDECRPDSILSGLQVLIRDPSVHVVCMNLFTGIVDGERIVSALLKMLSQESAGAAHKKFFLRLEGTNAQRGILLAESSSILKAMSLLDEAVNKAVAAAKAR